MACYEQAWAEWLACDNPYAIGDRAAMEAGGRPIHEPIGHRPQAHMIRPKGTGY